jgi:Co/Zn/Cd efflux system component
MMIAEIVGGLLFGSIALVADGMHMSTHAGALLLAAFAYSFARKHADDPRFAFGTGKLGNLAGFTSAIILAMIALLIGYEAVSRFFAPVSIHFSQAIPIACLGLAVNVASAWILSGGDHGHGHGHSHSHGGDDDARRASSRAPVRLCLRFSRTAFRRASACTRKRALASTLRRQPLKPCVLVERGSYLTWRVAEIIWNQLKKFPNRMRSWPGFASRETIIRLPSRNTNGRTASRTAITTCGLLSFT